MNNYHLITGPEAEALSKEELRNVPRLSEVTTYCKKTAD